jgi:putative flippase GtrA
MSKKANLIREIVRFILVGILATLVHITVVWSIIRADMALPLLANLIAFLIAFFISFLGHFYWTFNSQLPRNYAAARFFLIAAVGFFINSFVLFLLLQQSWIASEWAAVTSTLFVPIVTFIASRFWGFSSVVR